MRISDWSSDVCSSDLAAPRLAVIVALRRRSAEDFDLAIVQPEPAINGGDLRFESALVRQEDARRAAFDDRRRDRAGLDIGQTLGGEDDAGVLLAQGLEPFAQLRGEGRAVEHQPALVDDDPGRRTIEATLDAVDQSGEPRP